VIPADDPRPLHAADLVNLLGRHGIESHRLSASVDKPEKVPEGSYVIRMDQPYSRMADMLLDRQYYSTSDPRPYDDTGWSLGPLRNIRTLRIADAAFLDHPMSPVKLPAAVQGSVTGPAGAAAYVIAHTAENPLATFRFRLPKAKIVAAEEGFEAAGRKYSPGSWIIPFEGNPSNLRAEVQRAAAELGLRVTAVDAIPKVATHSVATPRVALVHSWLSTQNEGWYRIAFDAVGVPYTYISDHVLRDTANLRERFDVIVFGPTPGAPQRVVNGLPMFGLPIPWKASQLTPNFGTSPDQSEDIRGGMGLAGLVNVQRFVDQGGLFVFVTGNIGVAIEFGLVEGVSIVETRELQARGSVMNAVIADGSSPVTYGYGETVPVYFNQAPVLRVSRSFGGGQGGGGQGAGSAEGRTSGRGSATDPDIPQGRPLIASPPSPEIRPGEEPPLTAEQRQQLRAYLPPPELQPRVLLRFAEERNLLVSGMLAGGRELARTPAVVDVPRGKGHFLLFANNPIWRHQTQGSFFLLFNAMLHFDHLHVSAPAPQRQAAQQRQSAW
jgi:hypothetical protein